jgi:hypothetical protein
MIENKQDQRATEGAIAIQSARDTIIQGGISPADMRAIISELASQIPALAAVAREVADARLDAFEERLLAKFAERDKANSAAFKDPDFQYLLTRAQHAYARSGDEVTRDTLVDLIAKRSKERQRSRLSLTLNEAVEKAAVLTTNEFAELSLCYFLSRTVFNGVGNVGLLGAIFLKHVSPLLSDISREEASYAYLVAQSCADVGIGSSPATEIIRRTYGGLFSKGFARNLPLPGLSPERSEFVHRSALVLPCLHNPENSQIRAINEIEFKKLAEAVSLSTQEATQVWNVFNGTIMNGEELINTFEKSYPDVRSLIDLWDKTPLARLQLTTVGTAIGYANLARVTGFEADLGIWIK